MIKIKPTLAPRASGIHPEAPGMIFAGQNARLKNFQRAANAAARRLRPHGPPRCRALILIG
jgi:hypothetical protein